MDRLLGPEEFKFWLLDRRAPFNVCLRARLSGAIPIDALKDAAAQVATRHSALQSRIEVSGRPRFVDGGAEPPEVRLLSRTGEDDWRRECEEELARPRHGPGGSPWRLTLLAGEGRSDLLVTASHVVADGESVLVVLRDLLRVLGGERLAALEALPSVEELIPPEAFGSRRIAERIASWWTRATERRFQDLDYADLVANLPAVGRTRVLAGELTREETARLLATLEARGLKVQAFLGAATLRALAGDSPRELSILHIVGLRRRVEPPLLEDVGLFISQVATSHRVHARSDPWDLAQEIRDRLSEAIERRAPEDNLARTIQVLSPAGRIEGELEPTATVSNLGLVRFDRLPGAPEVERVSVNAGIPTPAPVIEVLTFAGKLSCHFLYPESWRRRAEAEELLDRVLSTLRAS